MRLICPNCAAQYEIDAALIPKGGRDVQCSSCGNAWFVAGKEAPASQAETGPNPAPVKTLERPAPPVGSGPRASNDPVRRAAQEDETAPTTDAPEEPAQKETPPEPAPDAPAMAGEDEALPPRRELDPRTRAILLEEAERESAARRGTAPAFGPAGAPPRPEPAPPPRQDPPVPAPQKKPAALQDAPAHLATPPDAGSRSNPLLPDVEEINSTLTPRSRPRPAPARPPEPRKASPDAKRSGVWIALAAVLALALVLAALYVAAPAIAGAVPALEPLVTGYVGAVNDLRAALTGS